MEQDPDLQAGMYVLSVDGQKLGRIARLDGDGFDVVLGKRDPRGFRVETGDVLSKLKGEIFLRLRLRDYLPLYEPRARAAPEPNVHEGGAGRRFFLFRRNEARW